MEYCPGLSLWHKIELVRRDAISRQKLMQSQNKQASDIATPEAVSTTPQLWLGLTPQFIAKIFRQMVEGLYFLHLHGVIHAGTPPPFPPCVFVTSCTSSPSHRVFL